MVTRSICGLVAVAVWLGAAEASAQQRGGEVSGVVREAAGAAAAGVVVTMAGDGVIAPRTAETTRQGRFWFAEVPPGRYRLRFSRPPDEWEDREVRVDLGSRVSLVVRPAGAAAPSGASRGDLVAGAVLPALTDAALGVTITRSDLAALPTARDAWRLIDMAPGVLGEPPAGRDIGARSEPRWTTRGSLDRTLWHVDGAAWADLASRASLPLDDFETIDQVRVQTAGHDASIQAPGASVSLVTRAGSNRLSGSGRWLWSGRPLEARNLTDAERGNLVDAGDPLLSSHEMGSEAGGPIRPGRAWFFLAGSFERAEHAVFGLVRDPLGDRYDPDNLHPQTDSRGSAQARIDARGWERQAFTLVAQISRRRRNPFEPAPASSPESWSRLHGVAPALRLSHQATAGRLLVDSRASYADGSQTADYQDPDQAGIQPAVDMPTQGMSRSGRRVERLRRTVEVRTDGAILVGGGRRPDHAIRFGARWGGDQDGEHSQVGGGATANFWKRLPNGATLYRDGDQHHRQTTWSIHASDTVALGRATLVAGLRLDRQTDRAGPSAAAAHLLAPEWLPALDFAGASAGVAFTDLAPRLTFTWDLTGSGRTVAKVHAGRYFGSGITASRRLDPSGPASVTLPWSDDNRDGFVQRSELHPASYLPPLVPSPQPASTGYIVDPNLSNDRVAEVLATLEHTLGPGLAARVTAIWRRADRFEEVRREGLGSADFVPVVRSVDRCTEGRCADSATITYYDLPFEPPAGRLVTNLDAHTTYRGVEIGVRGRPSAHATFDATLTLSDNRLHYHGEGSYQDPTRIPFEDGAAHGAMNARWQFRSSGIFSLPWGVSSALVVSGRQGYPLVESVVVSYRRYLGSVVVPLAPIGTTRLDDLWTIDWRLEKSARLGARRVSASLDLFNAANRATPIRRQNLVDQPNAGAPLATMAPRAARIGLRIDF